MTLRLLFAALLCACAAHSSPPIPPMDPELAATAVVDGVLAASAVDAVEPVPAWRRAHATFEAQLEGPLRVRYGDRTVAELEYRFGRVRSQLGTAQAPETARQLGEQVAALCADLPRPGV